MDVLFLDIDGVLTNHAEWKECEKIPTDFFYPYLFAPSCVKNLNHILNKVNVEIILSSTWRLSYWENIGKIFTLNKITSIPIDRTPKLNDQQRGKEILLWLDNCRNAIRKFAILDDDKDFDDIQTKEALFFTETEFGLTREIADKIIRYFKED